MLMRGDTWDSHPVGVLRILSWIRPILRKIGFPRFSIGFCFGIHGSFTSDFIVYKFEDITLLNCALIG